MSITGEPESSTQVYAFPAVPLQQRLWMLNTHRADPAWNVAVRFKLSGNLSVSRLQNALDDVVRRTEILRTGFTMIDGELKQLVSELLSVPIRLADYHTSGDFDRDLLLLSHAEAETPFSMQERSLLRVVLVRHNAEEHYLLVTAHHAIVDGYSIGLLSDALIAAYGHGDVPDHQQAHSDVPLQFADYALWLEQHRQRTEYREHSSYWERTLADVPVTPQKLPTGTLPQSQTSIESLLLPRSLTNAAGQLAQRLNATFPQMALAVFACSASRLNTLVGIPVASRKELQLETMIGPFVNYLPLKISSSPDTSFELLLTSIAEVSRETLEHGECRYEDILQAKGCLAGSLFNTVFICQRDFVQPRSADGIELTAIPSVSPGALHELTVFLVERSDGWRLSCEVGASHKPGFATDLLQRYRGVLQAICDNPSIAVASLIDQAPAPTLLGSQQTGESAPARSFRASATQQRYWALNRIDPSSNRLNLHIRYAVEGALDHDAFRKALQFLTLRHEALRTFFTEDDGDLRQHVSPAMEAPLHLYDDPEQALDAEAIAGLLDQEKQHSFDLEQGALWSVLVVTTGTRNYFSLTLSHSISDGWSCGILIRELLVAYDAIMAGKRPDLAPLSSSFGTIARAETEDRNFDERLAYWDITLENPSPILQLPMDREQSFLPSALVETRAIDPMLSVTVIQLARDYGVTAATVYAAAYRALLLKYTGNPDLLIASPAANRAPGTENIIGPFADSLILRTDVGSTFEEALEATQQALLSAVEHAVPLQYLMERIRHSNVHHAAAISIGFMYQEAFVHDLVGDRLTLRTMVNPIVESSFDWHMAVIDRQGKVTVEFTADQTTMTQKLAAMILEDFELSLSSYVVAPRKQLVRVAGSTQQVKQMCEFAQARKQDPRPELQTSSSSKAPVASAETVAGMLLVWQTIFGRSQITAHENFFALGGHSLLLARLQVALEKQFGYRIFASDIFAAPTCELLANRMTRGSQMDNSMQSRIIAVQPEGKEPPLFVISQSMIVRELADHLKPHQPTFTIQLIQEDVDHLGPDATMQQVAALYINYLRTVRPAGPYRLGGWCVSGWVAYEMAQQLRASGEDVDLLLILDAWAPNFWRDMQGVTRVFGRSSYYAHRAYFKVLQLLSSHQTRAPLQIGSPSIRQRLTAMFSFLTSKPPATSRFEAAFDQTMNSAIESYRPEPYNDDRTLVFRSAEQPRGGTLPDDMGWYRYLSANVEVVSLPGDHTGMFSGQGAEMMATYISRKVTGGQTLLLWDDESSKMPSTDLLNASSCPR